MGTVVIICPMRSKPIYFKQLLSKPWLFFIVCSLGIFSLWLYLPPYIDSFLGDDFVQQWRIRTLITQSDNIWQVFNPTWTDWYYRPVQNLWFLANRLAFGLNPFGYYVLQIYWHLLAVALVYKLARQLGLARPGAIVATALFAINASHQLTVSWISSIAIIMGAVFALAATVSYLTHLKTEHYHWLFLTIIGAALTMAIHEEGFVLPFFLIIVWLSHKWAKLRKVGLSSVRRVDWIGSSCLLLLAIAYGGLQLARPNANIGIGDSLGESLVATLNPITLARFTLVVTGRWTFVYDIPIGKEVIDDLADISWLAVILAAGILWFIFNWVRQSGRSVRWAFLCSGLHIDFIYVALWSQRPELLGSRHLYNAWIGLCIALGFSWQNWYVLAKTKKHQPATANWWPRQSQRQRQLIGGLLIFLFLHVIQIQFLHDHSQQLANQIKDAEQVIKSELPQLASNNKLFAARFPLTAPYFNPVTSIWYDVPHLQGGSLNALKEYEQVTNDFYLFDYDNGQLYNLMPELQAHETTIFLWREALSITEQIIDNIATPLVDDSYAQDLVVGPPQEKHLAVRSSPQAGEWVSLGYSVFIPPESELAMYILGQPGHTFRLRVETEDGTVATLFRQTLEAGSGDMWQAVQIPLTDYSGQTVIIRLESTATSEAAAQAAFWGNPRLVID